MKTIIALVLASTIKRSAVSFYRKVSAFAIKLLNPIKNILFKFIWPNTLWPFFMVEVINLQHPVILFDGVCNLCNAAVQFVINKDKKAIFKFASLQSHFGQSVMDKYGLPASGFDSFILLNNEEIYTKSTAALMVARHLSGLWSLLYLFKIIPSFIRDFVYSIIAKNRYKWFGKKAACPVPTEELKIRFFY